VHWEFLLEILRHLGFGQVWCHLILNLLLTSSTQVLVNGVPGQPINLKRGLRQGDPLSPLLFIPVMDILNSLFTRADECGLLHPLAGRSISQRVSMFADDVVVFVKPVSGDLVVVREILRCLGVASSLQTNLQKSFSYPIRCDNERIELAVQTLGCASKNFPTAYLGLPLSSKKLSAGDHAHWIEKIAAKFPGWKAELLNLAGRITLIKSVISAIPVYLFIALNAPKWVIKAFDKIRRNFL
jgi:hypothetical protein